jgi:hypothetical protein
MEWEEGHTYGYLVVVRESGVEGSSFPIMDDVTIGRQAYLLARMIGHTKPTSTAFPCPTRLPTTSHWSSVQNMVSVFYLYGLGKDNGGAAQSRGWRY